MRRLIFVLTALVATAGFAIASSSAHAQDSGCSTVTVNGSTSTVCGSNCTFTSDNGVFTSSCSDTQSSQPPPGPAAPPPPVQAPSEPAQAPEAPSKPAKPTVHKPQHHKVVRHRAVAFWPAGFVNYDMRDPRWANHAYKPWGGTVGDSGCFPTSMAMIAATLTGERSVTPRWVADLVGSVYNPGIGPKNIKAILRVTRHFGLSVSRIDIRNMNRLYAAVHRGGLGMILVGTGHFSGSSHYMVVRAVRNGYFRLADPRARGLYKDSETRWFSASFLRGPGRLVAAWTFK